MKKNLFEIVMNNAKNLPKCDFPTDATLRQICSEMDSEQLSVFCEVLISKGVFEYEAGRIVTFKERFVIV